MNKHISAIKEMLESTKNQQFPCSLFKENKDSEEILELKKDYYFLRKEIGKLLFDLKASEIKDISHPENKAYEPDYWGGKCGSLVKIRPCGEEYKDKTYVGFLLGSIALSSVVNISNDKIKCNFGAHNPAIFVPEIKKVIFGCESWWGKIESEEELKNITDKDIDNVWYVKALKNLQPEKS